MKRQPQTEILVIGGGVIGLACALYLAEAGRGVQLIEQESIGSGASRGNCGLLFFSEILPLCQASTARGELGRCMRCDSPLYIPLDFNFSKMLWLLNFYRKCTQSHMRHALAARGRRRTAHLAKGPSKRPQRKKNI